jgi:hypothetical protein
MFSLGAWPASTAAGTLDCAGPELTIASPFDARWTAAVESVRTRMTQALDLDRCATIRLEPVGDEMTVKVMVRDGRRAARRVAEPQDLLEAVEALLILPSAALAALPASVAEGPAPMGAKEGGIARSSIAATPIAPAHIELGLGAAGRVAGAPVYGGAGLASFAQLSRRALLVGVSARFDAVDETIAEPSPGGFNMQTIALGVVIGHRLAVADADLDAIVGPEIVIEMQEADGPDDGIGGRASDLRFDLTMRLSFRRQARARFFAAADVEASPLRIRRSQHIHAGLPALPSWSSGLSLGIVWTGL